MTYDLEQSITEEIEQIGEIGLQNSNEKKVAEF